MFQHIFRKNNQEEEPPIHKHVHDHPEEVKESPVGLSVPVDEEKVELQLQSIAVTTSENTDGKELDQTDESTIHKEEQPQPRKKHIPFNVVMLKQDYKRLNVPIVNESEKQVEVFQESVVKPSIVATKQELNKEERSVEAAVPVEIVQDRVIESVPNLMNTEENEGTLSSTISSPEAEEIHTMCFQIWNYFHLRQQQRMTKNG